MEENQIKTDPQETLIVSEVSKILELCESLEEVKKVASPLIEKGASAGEVALKLIESRQKALQNYEKEKASVPAIESEDSSSYSEAEEIKKNAELLAGVKK